MTKLLFIALDGATLDLLNPWMEAGHLPLLKRLYDEGTGGTLLSTVPWATPTAFASFMTGTNPGKHGVYDFGKLIKDDYTAFVPTNGSHVRGATLWGMLGNAGISTLTVNMPMTYPAENVADGVVFAGIPYPANSPRLCHPPELLNQVRTAGWDLSLNSSDDLGGTYASYYAGLIELIHNRAHATAHLMRQNNPDAVFIHFLEPDQVQHRYWIFMEGEQRYDPNGEFKNAILNLYKETEIAIQTLIDAAGDDVTICVMSDHGFGPMRHQASPNNWLVQNGFLTLKSGLGMSLKKLIYRLGLSPALIRENLPERLKMALLQFFERQKGRAIATEQEESDKVAKKGWGDWFTERVAIDFYDVDWANTVAFSTGTTSVGYVWLNVVGRDPQGVVKMGDDYQKTRADIAQTLRTWDAVGEVLTREEVWHGSELDTAPDLIIRWAKPTTDARFFQTRFSSPHIMRPVPNDNAIHRPDGMFVWHGKHIKQGQTVHANILDLAPTILWLLEQPVPTNMDGQVLTDIFDLTHPITHTEPMETQEKNLAMTAAEEQAVKDVLRGLGYLD
jgi:predicted AlkP superfamily phosphohydrolase/phosphomutase